MPAIVVCAKCGHGGSPKSEDNNLYCKGCKKNLGYMFTMAYEPTEIIKFGKYSGSMLMDIPHEYLIWLYNNAKINKQLKFYIETVVL